MVILTTIAPLRVYFLSHHRAPYSRVIINFTQGVVQLLLVSSFCGVRLFPSISVWLSSHIRSYKSNESETAFRYEWSRQMTDFVFLKFLPSAYPKKKSPHDMCFFFVSNPWHSSLEWNLKRPHLIIFSTKPQTAPLCSATQWGDLHFTLLCNHLNSPAWGQSWAEMSRAERSRK